MEGPEFEKHSSVESEGAENVDAQGASAELPPPGWYADPTGVSEIRWWTGSAWATTGVDRSEVGQRKEKLAVSASDWFRESVKVYRASFSQLYVIVVVFLLPVFLVLALAAWNAYSGLTFTLITGDDTVNASIEDVKGLDQLAAGLVYILLGLAFAWIASVLVVFVSANQAVQAQASRPATWTQSVSASLRHRRRLAAVSAVLFACTMVVSVLFSLGAGGFLAGLILTAILWVPLSFVSVLASVGDSSPGLFSRAGALVRARLGEVLGRFAFLTSWTVLACLGWSLVSQIIFGFAAEDPQLPGTTDTFVYSFRDAFGGNPYIWAIVVVFFGLFWGLLVSFWSVALTLLYRDLGGTLDVEDLSKVVVEDSDDGR